MNNRMEKLEGQMAGNTNQIAENTLQIYNCEKLRPC